jgi:hypothetical protein
LGRRLRGFRPKGENDRIAGPLAPRHNGMERLGGHLETKCGIMHGRQNTKDICGFTAIVNPQFATGMLISAPVELNNQPVGLKAGRRIVVMNIDELPLDKLMGDDR